MKTLVFVLLDSSASMGTCVEKTTVAFNKLIEEQKKVSEKCEESCRVSLYGFNEKLWRIYKPTDIKLIPELEVKDLELGGGTALYSSVIDGILVADKFKENNEEVLFVIITDGEENSSQIGQKQMMDKLLANYTIKTDWKFIYLGVDPAYWKDSYGITSERFGADVVDGAFNALNQTISKFRLSK